MSWSDAISDAIERSKASGSQSQAVSVGLTVASLEDLLMVLMVTLQTDWWMDEIDDNRVEVRGWSSDTPANEQDWRLVVQCVAAEEMVA